MADLWIKARTEIATGDKVGRLVSMVEKLDGFDQWSRRRLQKRRLLSWCALEIWNTARGLGSFDGADLVVEGITLEDLDEIAGLDGFGAGMVAVGWIVEEGAGLRFVNFTEWNPPRTGAERARDARKKKAGESLPSGACANRAHPCALEEKEKRRRREGEPSLPSRDLEASLIGFGRFSTAKDLAREIFTRCGLLTVSAFDALPKWDRVFLVKVAALFELRELPEAVLHEAIESVRVNKPKGDKLAYFRKCLHNSRYGNGREWLEDLIARVDFEGSEDF